MNVLPAGLTPPIGVRRTITDECFGMWASSSVYSAKHGQKQVRKLKKKTKANHSVKICSKVTADNSENKIQ